MPRANRTICNSDINQEQIEAEVLELCRQHMAPLTRYAASLTKQKSIIHKAMQDTFLRYFFTRMGGGRVENPRAWLARVLRNDILDRCRKSKLMLPLADTGISIRLPQEEELVESQDKAFRRAMASLSYRERECLQLRVEGYVYEELAHIMQIRKGVVGALLSRALRNFRNSEALAEQPYNRSRDTTDTFSLISQLRLALAETQYRRRIQHRIWAYVFTLGLLTAAAALAAVLMK
jgi:RNA polymerase sigma factor (sigma-70 family)